MKKTLLLGFLTCVLGLFTACSSDKNDDNNGGTIIITGEKIAGFTDNVRTIIYNIQYDKQGRLVSATIEKIGANKEKKSVLTYTYSNNQIQAQSTGDREAVSTFYLKNGKITNSTLKGDDSDVVECIYDSNDQLTNVITKDNSTNILWDRGNIIKLSTQSKDYNTTDIFIYTNHSAKNFIPLVELDDCVPAIDGVDPILFMQGYYGKVVNNLVKEKYGYTTFSSTSSTKHAGAAYTYTLDNNGKVVKATDNKGYIGNYTWK